MRNPQNCKVKLVYHREQLKAREELLYVKESSWFYLSASILFCQFLLQYMSCSNTSKRRPLRVQTVQTVNFSFFSNTCLPLHLWLAYILPRENEGTERDIQGVGWDMSISLKLFLVLGGNGSLFPQTSEWYLSPVDLGIEKSVSVEIRFVSRNA